MQFLYYCILYQRFLDICNILGAIFALHLLLKQLHDVCQTSGTTCMFSLQCPQNLPNNV